MASRHRINPVTVRIPPDTLARLDALAEQLDMTRNALINDCVARVVNDANLDHLDTEIPGQLTLDGSGLPTTPDGPGTLPAASPGESDHQSETPSTEHRHLHNYAPIQGDEYYRSGIKYGTWRCECGLERTDKLP